MTDEYLWAHSSPGLLDCDVDDMRLLFVKQKALYLEMSVEALSLK